MALSEVIETARMRLRFLDDSDADVVHRQFSDSDMCEFFSEPPCDMDEARGIIEHYQNPEGKGHLRYGMFNKETGEFIGTLGYHYWDRELRQVEIGYDVWKDFWKQGYMSEALPVLLKICFEHLQVDCIYILAHPKNEGSLASVRKYGFIKCDPCRTPDVEPQVCMKLMREKWVDPGHPGLP